MGKGAENNRTPYTCRDKVRNQKRGATSVREAEYIASPAGTTVSWVAKSSGALPWANIRKYAFTMPLLYFQFR